MNRRNFFRACAAAACSVPTVLAGKSPVAVHDIDWDVTTLKWEEYDFDRNYRRIPIKVQAVPLPIIHSDFCFPPRTRTLT